jgi:hypothetical protein
MHVLLGAMQGTRDELSQLAEVRATMDVCSTTAQHPCSVLKMACFGRSAKAEASHRTLLLRTPPPEPQPEPAAETREAEPPPPPPLPPPPPGDGLRAAFDPSAFSSDSSSPEGLELLLRTTSSDDSPELELAAQRLEVQVRIFVDTLCP